MTPSKHVSRRHLLAWAALTLVVGCGGGGGSSSPSTSGSATGTTTGGQTTSGVGTGGTGTGTGSSRNAEVYSVGTITGFGSIIVGGVRYDDSAASVTDDSGGARRSDDLKLGMTVEIRSSTTTTDAQGVVRAVASQIVVNRSITGPVSSVDGAAGTVLILGQTVVVTATTVFDGLSGLSALAAGQIVEVYAVPDAQGRLVATRIERKDSLGSDNLLRISGAISSLNAARTEFRLGNVTVQLSAPLAPVLANGSEVRVLARSTATVNVLVAVSVQPRSSGLSEGVREARVEGYITALSSSQSFTVNGINVVANAATRLEGSTAALKVGALVEVEGTVSGSVLTATKIEIEDEKSSGGPSGSSSGSSSNSSAADSAPFEIHGPVASVDVAGMKFVVRGLTISWDATTEFRDGTVALLVVGRNVEVRGIRGSDGTSLRALRIKFES